MKKILIITAHPSQHSFTFAIAHSYTNAAKKHAATIENINLYQDTKYQQSFVSFEEAKETWTQQDIRDAIQEKISWADELVFIYPTWWSAAPAIMKNFFDNNFTAGFAFTYQNGKPKGLLTSKTVRIFTTADSPAFLFILLKPMLYFTQIKAIFGFCGMHIASFDIFSDLAKKRSDKERQKMLALVEKRALQITS